MLWHVDRYLREGGLQYDKGLMFLLHHRYCQADDLGQGRLLGKWGKWPPVGPCLGLCEKADGGGAGFYLPLKGERQR